MSARLAISTSRILQQVKRKRHPSIDVPQRECIDNSIMESFFGRLKNEMYYGLKSTYKTFEEFSKAIDEYINYFNYRKNSIQNKMDVSCKIRGNIHDSSNQ